MIKGFIGNDEKKLAIKISWVVFLMLVLILGIVITTSYLFSYRQIKKELRQESQSIFNIPEAREIFNNIKIWLPNNRIDPRKRWPRDIIVINENNNSIIKNDFLDIDDKNLYTLYSIKRNIISEIIIDWKKYLVTKNTIDTNSVIFFRDLTPLQNFHMILLIVAIISSWLGLMITYLISRYFAHITIEPIRQQAIELEAYSHNVAHELRTPLSIMKSNLELLKIKPENRFIESSNEEITWMEHIIDSLLFLAKPKQNNLTKKIDLIKKTQEIITRYQDKAEINLDIKAKVIYQNIDEELYNRIITNLIENAIKYKSEWVIQIKLDSHWMKIINSIEQDLSDQEQKNILKVFYQWDVSRNSSWYGLGLALVSKIIQIFDWQMEIISKNKQFIIEIQFS